MSGPERSMHEEEPKNPDVSFERRDVDPAAIWRAAIALAGATAVVAGIVLGMLFYLRHRERAADQPLPPVSETRPLVWPAQPAGGRANFPPPSGSPRPLPSPLLQTQPFADVRTLREEDMRTLGSYGWVDQPAGVVRIPIEQAMKLLIERQKSAPLPTPPPAVGNVPTESAPVPPARGGGGR